MPALEATALMTSRERHFLRGDAELSLPPLTTLATARWSTLASRWEEAEATTISAEVRRG